MKLYKVYWDEHPWKGRKIPAESPEEAYQEFLESEAESKNLAVAVNWGLFGDQLFSNHVVAEDQRPQKGSGGSGGKAKQASVASSSSSRQEQILLRIESKLSQIHWAVLGVGMMFAMVFIITPQCSQM